MTEKYLTETEVGLLSQRAISIVLYPEHNTYAIIVAMEGYIPLIVAEKSTQLETRNLRNLLVAAIRVYLWKLEQIREKRSDKKIEKVTDEFRTKLKDLLGTVPVFVPLQSQAPSSSRHTES